jgi:hypothetical protein
MSSWKPAPRAQRYFVVTGRAYPNVLKGKNPTDVVEADLQDRQQLYHDKSMMLSDANLDEFNGTQGAPIWEEHGQYGKHQVGYVHHSWVTEKEKGGARGLKIIARIPLGDEHPHGERVARLIKEGHYTGFSVGYEASLVQDKRATRVGSKSFREISLVREPFFDNCQLSWGVEAAAKRATANPDYKSSGAFYASIEASGEEMAEQQQQPTQQTSPPPAVPESRSVGAEELLAQADSLKERGADAEKALAALKRENELLKARDEMYKAREAKERADYAAAQEPKFREFIEPLKASMGGAMTESMEQAYRETFCNPDFKEHARGFIAQHEQRVALMASKLAAEEKLAAVMREKEELQSAVTKTAAVINSSRSSFAHTLRGAEDDDDSNKRKVDVGASKELHLSGMMEIPNPSLAELPFLKQHGFGTSAQVTASTADGTGEFRRAMPRTIERPREHRNLFTDDGELALPNSARYQHPAMFAWMVQAYKNGPDDFSDMARMRPDKSFIERRYEAEAAAGLSGGIL